MIDRTGNYICFNGSKAIIMYYDNSYAFGYLDDEWRVWMCSDGRLSPLKKGSDPFDIVEKMKDDVIPDHIEECAKDFRVCHNGLKYRIEKRHIEDHYNFPYFGWGHTVVEVWNSAEPTFSNAGRRIGERLYINQSVAENNMEKLIEREADKIGYVPV